MLYSVAHLYRQTNQLSVLHSIAYLNIRSGLKRYTEGIYYVSVECA